MLERFRETRSTSKLCILLNSCIAGTLQTDHTTLVRTRDFSNMQTFTAVIRGMEEVYSVIQAKT